MTADARIDRFRGEAAVGLRAGALEATFLPALGMLGASLRYQGDELLALPGGPRAYRSGHQTGLPLLAPWANRLAERRYRAAGVDVDLTGAALHTDPGDLPIHGTMTARREWSIAALEAEGATARLVGRFDFGSRPDLMASFPFPHELSVEAVVDSRSLVVATSIRPTGDRPVPVAFGWHPYLRLPHSPRRAWLLHLPRRQHLLLDERGIPTGASEAQPAEAGAIGRRTFDDLYALTDERELAIEAHGLRLSVRGDESYPFGQVYAPAGQGFVCLEPMTAPTNALVAGATPLVAPGTVFTARFSVTVDG